MGIFDNFMEGETGGIPNGIQGALSGNNPMLNIGLGILANNTGNYGSFGAAIGKGAQQGIQSSQTARQMQMQQMLYKSQLEKARKDLEEAKATDAAVKAASEQHPEYAALFKLDPKAAIKMLYPQANSADPYKTLYWTDKGPVEYDNRQGGKLTPLTLPDSTIPMKSTDSPDVRGAVKGAEARATAGYKINTDTGSVMTDRQVAESLDPALQGAPQLPTSGFSTPYPVTFGAPGTTATDRMEGVTGENSIQLRDPARPNRPSSLRYPTLAEQAAAKAGAEASARAGVELATKPQIESATTTAKNAAEFNSPENIKKRDQLKQFKTTTAKNVISSIDSVLGRVDNWSAGMGGNIVRALPFNSDAKDIVADIETVKANFGFDRLQAMRDMSPTGGALGQVAVQELTALQASVANLDPEKQSPKQLQKNLTKAKTHYQNWLDTIEGNKSEGEILPNDAMMPNNKKSAVSTGGWSAKKVK